MPKVRIATFNCENLFARYRFGKNVPMPMADFTINDIAFDIHSTRDKRITAKAIKDIDADIICLQEVENQPVLDRFNSEFLARSKSKRYGHRVLIDGNDPRKIDVAFLSRYPIKAIRSHRHDRNKRNTAPAFSRDCLRVDVDIEGHTLTLYGNHFKSMMGGRAQTRERRIEQAERVHEILTEDWGKDFEGDFVVLGDFNDYPEKDKDENGDVLVDSGVNRLIRDRQLVNVNKRLPRGERWTHYWAGGRTYTQLDYLLLSKQLDIASGCPVPGRNLQGLPWRADDVDVERYEDVGYSEPKASDHVPLYVDVLIGEASV